MPGRKEFQQVVANAPKQQLKTAINSPATPIAATTGTEIIDFYATAGSVGKIQTLYISIPAAVGAASGTQAIYIKVELGQTGSSAQGISNFGDALLFDNLNFVTATNLKNPASDTAQGAAVQNLYFDDAFPFRLFYNNLTNAIQNGTRKYIISYMETVRG